MQKPYFEPTVLKLNVCCIAVCEKNINLKMDFLSLNMSPQDTSTEKCNKEVYICMNLIYL
jgi:hypothetical protein